MINWSSLSRCSGDQRAKESLNFWKCLGYFSANRCPMESRYIGVIVNLIPKWHSCDDWNTNKFSFAGSSRGCGIRINTWFIEWWISLRSHASHRLKLLHWALPHLYRTPLIGDCLQASHVKPTCSFRLKLSGHSNRDSSGSPCASMGRRASAKTPYYIDRYLVNLRWFVSLALPPSSTAHFSHSQ